MTQFTPIFILILFPIFMITSILLINGNNSIEVLPLLCICLNKFNNLNYVTLNVDINGLNKESKLILINNDFENNDINKDNNKKNNKENNKEYYKELNKETNNGINNIMFNIIQNGIKKDDNNNNNNNKYINDLYNKSFISFLRPL
jgi:hypothetical protein